MPLGVFHDDLRQDYARQVLAGTGVDHLHFHAFPYHAGYIVQVDVAAGGGVVEAPVFVFFDDHFAFRHNTII